MGASRFLRWITLKCLRRKNAFTIPTASSAIEPRSVNQPASGTYVSTKAQDASANAFREVMAGEGTPVLVAALLAALRAKGETADEVAGAAENAGRLMENMGNLAGETGHSISRLSRELAVTVQNLEKASDNLNRMTELLADHPSLLIFGEPPPPRSPSSRRSK